MRILMVNSNFVNILSPEQNGRMFQTLYLNSFPLMTVLELPMTINSGVFLMCQLMISQPQFR